MMLRCRVSGATRPAASGGSLDPLGGLQFTDDDYHWITRELLKIADETAGGRVVSVLEGGYSLEGLASGTAAHVRALMGR